MRTKKKERKKWLKDDDPPMDSGVKKKVRICVRERGGDKHGGTNSSLIVSNVLSSAFQNFQKNLRMRFQNFFFLFFNFKLPRNMKHRMINISQKHQNVILEIGF